MVSWVMSVVLDGVNDPEFLGYIYHPFSNMWLPSLGARQHLSPSIIFPFPLAKLSHI